jgi:hypothetical protein
MIATQRAPLPDLIDHLLAGLESHLVLQRGIEYLVGSYLSLKEGITCKVDP